MRFSEGIAVVYFAYLALAAGIRPLPAERRWPLMLLASAASFAVLAVTRLAAPWAAGRDWAPLAYLLAGYRLSGRFFVRPMPAVERWLARVDERLRVTRLAGMVPRHLRAALEATYLSVYPLIPGAFAALYFSRRAGDADRFWSVVLAAAFACYGTLPWIQTRPPRALEPREPSAARRDPGRLRRLNVFVLHHGGIGANTIPSGHAAAALAAGLALVSAMPIAGSATIVLALGIAAASVIGRYHYAADAILGLAVAATVWQLLR